MDVFHGGAEPRRAGGSACGAVLELGRCRTLGIGCLQENFHSKQFIWNCPLPPNESVRSDYSALPRLSAPPSLHQHLKYTDLSPESRFSLFLFTFLLFLAQILSFFLSLPLHSVLLLEHGPERRCVKENDLILGHFLR